jgi:hypothetical protein
MAEQTPSEPKRFKIRHIFLGLLLVLLAWFACFRISAHRNVTRRLGQLRAQGYPMSLTELGRTYALAPGMDNAADYYLTAFSHYVEWDNEAREGLPWVSKGKRPARTEVMEPEIIERAERFLADNEKTLSLLHQAVAIESSRYPIDFEDQIGADVPWLGDVRKHAFLLALEAAVACERGEPNQAVASVQATLALARSLNTPVLIHRLVNIAVQGLAYRSAEYVVNRVSLTDEQLQTLSNWLESADYRNGQREALIGERCFGVDAFQGSTGHLSAVLGGPSKIMTLVMIPRKLLGLHDRDLLGYLDLMQDYIEMADLPPEEQRARSRSLEEAPHGPTRQGFLSKMLLPGLHRVFILELRHLAHRRAAEAALAVERYRLAEGGIPLALSDLVPRYLDAVPLDPFDGQKLRYRLREETGYVVYSVGEDLTDDGGTERDERKRNADNEIIWDVTFIVER